MTKPTFDIDAALQALRDGQDLTGKDGILTPLIKQLTEAAMQAELDKHLARNNGTPINWKISYRFYSLSLIFGCPFDQ